MSENKYHKGKIYTIRSFQTEKYYIGSTCNPLYKRLANHKYNYESYKKGKSNFITSFDIIKYEDCYIELLEYFKCETKEELNKREGELIRLHKDNIVNKCIPNRKIKEWYENNRETILEKKKEYHENNRETLIQKKKIYNEINKNKRLNYYQENKEDIRQKAKEKILCECGQEISRSGISKHKKTKIHLQIVNK